ncbi:DUF2948 family protein [Pseudorhodobacter sp. E13]|uniref:DUF2948 family protein n=1 Tax=Pseudorhodobacter sp. E13 TaxID=2487931 RepID=UPI000F8D5006|nr:DUF2948 family protein [Pseudorhodobacter sp. E13]RUS60692.1 DUF2948 family protein [Pseudorhodobacter sp. E13]
MSDARFEDGDEAPLALLAGDTDDLQVMSALLQDSVLAVSDMRYLAKRREFALLLNRFRWEDRAAAERAGRAYERVRCVLMFHDVTAVRSQGIHQLEEGTVLSLLALAFEPGEDGTGRVVLTLAGDGAVALEVEALNATLRDVTRPYLAPSRKMPEHR